ncbi:MAG: helix-turn-helix transcriptional regulator [Actinobacteria bacterium]|nr:MAG: helix-turn-helix transcriptional regulator [Actinomycetota bacterium]
MPKIAAYDSYCPIARALDTLGDRWTLLIMRELANGDHRFTDLRRNPAVATDEVPHRRMARNDQRVAAARGADRLHGNRIRPHDDPCIARAGTIRVPTTRARRRRHAPTAGVRRQRVAEAFLRPGARRRSRRALRHRRRWRVVPAGVGVRRQRSAADRYARSSPRATGVGTGRPSTRNRHVR